MARMPFAHMLSGGDRRSIGRSHQVVREVLADPGRFDELFAALTADDPVVRVRAADAAEKISAVHPELLRPSKAALLGALARSGDKAVRWHVAQILPRLRWNRRERRRVYEVLTNYLDDGSRIVKTFAMQALVDLTFQDPGLRPAVLRRVKRLTMSGSPAMHARGHTLLAALADSPSAGRRRASDNR